MATVSLPPSYQLPSQAAIIAHLSTIPNTVYTCEGRKKDDLIKKIAEVFAAKKVHEKGLQHELVLHLSEHFTGLPEPTILAISITITKSLLKLSSAKIEDSIEKKNRDPSASPPSERRPEVTEDAVVVKFDPPEE